MKRIGFIFIIICGAFILTGFKKPEYKTVDVSFEGKPYSLAIPSSFCQRETNLDNIFEFVKCYELNLQKEGELQFFSERILIAFEPNDKRIQNMTDKAFSKSQLNSYNNLSDEDKENYFYNRSFTENNITKAKIIDNTYVFSRTAENNNGDKFIAYETGLFLNKRYVIINWLQYLTKNEKLLSEKNFIDFVKENKKANEFNDILYNFDNRQILITKPRFSNYANYTDVSTFNVNNAFHGLFATLLNSDDDRGLSIFKISLIDDTITTEEGYDLIEKNRNDFKELKLVKYKGINFIKILRDDSVMYINYINFSKNITALLSFETGINGNFKDNKYLKEVYRYRQQLIEDNS